jgi:C4-dicarboxylate-specific signal transduction histidine kinase
MNMITRISPDAGTPSRNLSTEETQANHDGFDELVVLRVSELRVTNRRAMAGQLSASIAHEINQPLAAIASSGSAALRWLSLKNPDLNEVRSCLERMVADSHRAATVVDAVRAMYKKDVQSKSMVDLSELVAETLDLLRTEIVKDDVTVRKVETEKLPRVFADRVQLQQVLINLIKNAIDAMSSVNNRSRILHIQTELNHGEVIISVEDTGTGLTPSDMDNIFALFFTTKPQGMGVGLSICRNIVEMHGGRLWAAPGTPHGAMFQFTIPTASCPYRKSDPHVLMVESTKHRPSFDMPVALNGPSIGRILA